MRRHTLEGEQMLGRVGGVLASVGRIVRSTHEHYDGNGYTDGLAGGEIPVEARIVCACDAYSAMTTDRSYRKAMAAHRALEELRRCAGTQFDPRVVEVIARLVAVSVAETPDCLATLVVSPSRRGGSAAGRRKRRPIGPTGGRITIVPGASRDQPIQTSQPALK
jgi:hypothetical protein